MVPEDIYSTGHIGYNNKFARNMFLVQASGIL